MAWTTESDTEINHKGQSKKLSEDLALDYPKTYITIEMFDVSLKQLQSAYHKLIETYEITAADSKTKVNDILLNQYTLFQQTACYKCGLVFV